MADPKIANLTAEQIQLLRDLEQKLPGVYVIAYDQPLAPASLSLEQVAELQKAERELGFCLVAYHKPA